MFRDTTETTKSDSEAKGHKNAVFSEKKFSMKQYFLNFSFARCELTYLFLRRTNAYESLCMWKELTFHWPRINPISRVLRLAFWRLVSLRDQPLILGLWV